MNMKKIVLCLTGTMLICFGTSALILSRYSRPSLSKPETSNITNNAPAETNNVFSQTKVSNSSYTIEEEKNYSIDKIEQLNVATSSIDINFIPEERSDIKVHYYGNVTASNENAIPKLITNLEASSLNIKTEQQSVGINFGYNGNLKLDIYIPSNYNKSISTGTTSGNIDIKSLNLTNLICTTTSGSSNILNISSNELKCASASGKLNITGNNAFKTVNLSSASGNTHIENLTSDSFAHVSTSGDITADALYSKASKLQSSSGKSSISKFAGDLNCNSTSGNVSVQYDKEFSNNINITSSSGKIDIKLTQNPEFYLNAKSVSGNISCNFPIALNNSSKDKHTLEGIVKNSNNKILINTTTGNISIY